MLTIVHKLIGDRVLKRARASSQPRTAFEQRQAQTAIHQTRGGGKARESAADNHDMRSRRLRNDRHLSGMGELRNGRLSCRCAHPASRGEPRPAASARNTTVAFRQCDTEMRPSMTL